MYKFFCRDLKPNKPLACRPRWEFDILQVASEQVGDSLGIALNGIDITRVITIF
jgi:hypothetical protein